MQPHEFASGMYERYGERLRRYLAKTYPTLEGNRQTDDVIQMVFAELVEMLKKGLELHTDPFSW